MNDTTHSIVIIGGGYAAFSAAKQLREAGHAGALTVVAEEAHLPHERPPLSKGYLQGDDELSAVFPEPSSWYEEQRIDLVIGTPATAIDTSARTVALGDGRTLDYTSLLLATGARARTLEIPGHDLDGVFTLRTIDDSTALRDRLSGGDKRVVIVGAGWIGMEAAAAARALGNEVTVLARGSAPLASVLGKRIGADFQALHEEHGTVFRMGADVTGFEGTDGRVTGVTVDGETVPADLVLVGVGAIPNTELAQHAGIALDERGGVLVDAALRSSAPDVYAAGDIAAIEHAGAGRRLRSEHWAVALATGEAAARSMLGEDVSYDTIPFFFTDQWDLGMEMAGYPHRMHDADIVIRGDLAAREYIAFWVKDGRVGGGMNVNVWDVNEQIQDLIRSGRTVDVERLADPEVPLPELLD